MSMILVLFDDADLPVLPWAARLSTALGRPLRVLCMGPGDGPLRQRVTAEQVDADTLPLVRATLEQLPEAGAKDPQVHDCRGHDLRRAVLDAARDLEATDLVLAVPEEDREGPARGVIARLLRSAPEDVLLLDVAAMGDGPPQRILVPQSGGGGRHAMQLAARGLGAGEPPVVAVADPKRMPRSRRSFGRAREQAASAGERFEQVVPPEGQGLFDAVAGSIAVGDLVLLDAEDPRGLPRARTALRTLRKDRPETPFAVGVARSAEAGGPGRLARLAERVRMQVPVLSRDQRKDLHERISGGGRVSADFVVMLTLSAAIAALGLVQNSAAVVIGAMLVAPLMTPLVAAGMSLVQGNLVMFRAALGAMGLGVVGAVAVSAAVGAVAPWGDLSAQVLARGAPNLFDLVIAACSGMAAAYALARPGLAGTLVGVAIAVALVPPLSATGIAAAKAEWAVAIGAGLLFATNFLAIVLGAAMVFRFFGLQVSRQGEDAPRWVRGVLASLAVGIVATGVPLAHNLVTQTRAGVDRPYARPLPRGLRQQVAERVEREAGVRIFSMSQSDPEHGFGAEIVLLTRGPVPPGLVAEVEEMARAAMGPGMGVRVVVLREVG